MAPTRQGVQSKCVIVPEGGVEDESLSNAVLWVTGFVSGG
jgi:hypothetical protein